MNTSLNISFNPARIKEGYIYDDSRGRPVGLAGKVNRATCMVEAPTEIPLMTPEDRIRLNHYFERCVATVRQFIRSQP